MRVYGLILAAAALVVNPPASAGVIRHTEPDTGLDSWHWEDNQASFTFTQRLPDQTRAFFQGRGIRPDDAELIAEDCVFQAVIRNPGTAEDVMELDLAEWRVTAPGSGPRPLRLADDWQAQWQQRAVSQAARIAFRWSLLPGRQSFEPGDWNMGMVTLGLAPGSPFDLLLVWHAGPGKRQLRLEGMRCAPDR